MTEDERLDLWDLLPTNAPIWADDDELPHFGHATLRWWLDALGHERAHTACCKACGCCTTCMAGAFHQAVVVSTLRQLDEIGALVMPQTVVDAPESPVTSSTPSTPGAEVSEGTGEAQEGAA